MKNKPFGEAPLLRLVICLMAGIVVGDSVGTVSWLWPALIVLVVGTLLLWRYAVLQSVGIAVCFVLQFEDQTVNRDPPYMRLLVQI